MIGRWLLGVRGTEGMRRWDVVHGGHLTRYQALARSREITSTREVLWD